MEFDWKPIYDEIQNPNINKKTKIEFPKIDEKKQKVKCGRNPPAK